MNLSTNNPNSKIIGFGFLFTALFLFACQDILVKFLNQHFPVTFLLWARFAGNFIISLIIVYFSKTTITAAFKTKHWKLHLLRSLFLATTTMFYFNAIKTLPLTTSISIFFIYPLLIAALAPFLLQERLPKLRWLFIFTGMLGAMVVIRPTSSEFSWAMILVVGAAMSFCLYALTTRKLATTESIDSTNLYTAIVGTVVFLPSIFTVTTGDWTGPDNDWYWLLILLLGFVFGGISHYLVIHANQRVPASELASMFYTQIFWMILADVLFFNLIPDGFTILGCLIIIVSNLFVIRIELKAARKLAAAQAMSGYD